MARFIYSMQKILNIKIRLEDQAKLEFGMAQARLIAEQEKLQTLYERKAGYEDDYRRYSEGVLDLQKMQEAKEASLRMDDFIVDQKERIRRAEDELEVERRKLTAAIQERKIQEKLRERAFEQFLEEEKAAERKEIDELTSYTYGQKIDMQ